MPAPPPARWRCFRRETRGRHCKSARPPPPPPVRSEEAAAASPAGAWTAAGPCRRAPRCCSGGTATRR
eukprot:1764314-Prymnesium_polylepis.1